MILRYIGLFVIGKIGISMHSLCLCVRLSVRLCDIFAPSHSVLQKRALNIASMAEYCT